MRLSFPAILDLSISLIEVFFPDGGRVGAWEGGGITALSLTDTDNVNGP